MGYDELANFHDVEIARSANLQGPGIKLRVRESKTLSDERTDLDTDTMKWVKWDDVIFFGSSL